MGTKPVKKKRRTLWVEWDEDFKMWFYSLPMYQDKKDQAVKAACSLAKNLWQHNKLPCEVIVRTKSGRIGEGRGSRFTYGRDPRRSKG